MNGKTATRNTSKASVVNRVATPMNPAGTGSAARPAWNEKPAAAPAPASGLQQVSIQYRGDADAEVYVAGSFNGWKPDDIRLDQDGRGVYRATLILPRGRHEYRFIVNGVWCADPECAEQVPNVFGSTNSVLSV